MELRKSDKHNKKQGSFYNIVFLSEHKSGTPLSVGKKWTFLSTKGGCRMAFTKESKAPSFGGSYLVKYCHFRPGYIWPGLFFNGVGGLNGGSV